MWQQFSTRGHGNDEGEAQVPQEWLDADAAKEADDRSRLLWGKGAFIPIGSKEHREHREL